MKTLYEFTKLQQRYSIIESELERLRLKELNDQELTGEDVNNQINWLLEKLDLMREMKRIQGLGDDYSRMKGSVDE